MSTDILDNISINQINDYTNVYQDYDISNNITTNKMSKYEYTKVLGMRAQQITMGAVPLINVNDDMKSAEVAEELRQRKTPYITRKINGKKTILENRR